MGLLPIQTRRVWCGLLLSAALTGGGSWLSAQKSNTSSSELQLSTRGRKVLDKAFKHWQLASVDPQRGSCGPGGAAFAKADFDDDGQIDTALAIKVADGTIQLVVIFDRVDESIVTSVDSLGKGSLDGFVSVVRRGTKFRDAGGGVEDYFATDTLTVTLCGEPQTVYFWNGLGFRKLPLGK